MLVSPCPTNPLVSKVSHHQSHTTLTRKSTHRNATSQRWSTHAHRYWCLQKAARVQSLVSQPLWRMCKGKPTHALPLPQILSPIALVILASAAESVSVLKVNWGLLTSTVMTPLTMYHCMFGLVPDQFDEVRHVAVNTFEEILVNARATGLYNILGPSSCVPDCEASHTGATGQKDVPRALFKSRGHAVLNGNEARLVSNWFWKLLKRERKCLLPHYY